MFTITISNGTVFGINAWNVLTVEVDKNDLKIRLRDDYIVTVPSGADKLDDVIKGLALAMAHQEC